MASECQPWEKVDVVGRANARQRLSPGSTAHVLLTTDAATKPGKVTVYLTTYTLQNAPHYYASFHTEVTGPSF